MRVQSPELAKIQAFGFGCGQESISVCEGGADEPREGTGLLQQGVVLAVFRCGGLRYQGYLIGVLIVKGSYYLGVSIRGPFCHKTPCDFMISLFCRV